MALHWYIDADWNGDGAFETNEESRLIGLRTFRGKKNYLKAVKPDGAGFERNPVGTADITLDNYDGRYDPLNTSSPIYPNLMPGREMRIRVNDGADTWNVFRGKIDSLSPVRQGNQRRLKIKLVDGWAFLKGSQGVRKAVQTGLTTDTAIGYILTLIGWLAGWGSDLAMGSDTLAYWWTEGKNAADAILDLVENEFGRFHISGNGQAVFRGRNADFNSTASFTLDQSVLLKDPVLPYPWESIRNIIRLRLFPRVLQATGELWRMRGTPSIAPGDTLTVYAEFRYSNRITPAQNLIAPVVTTDYTMNSAADGSGTNLSANFSVTMTGYGETAKLVVTNNGTTAGYITLLKIRGDALDAPDSTLVEIDNSSGSLYGPRSFALDLLWNQNTRAAQDAANWLKSWMSSPLSYPVLQLEGRDTVQYAYELHTRFTLTAAELGINADYRLMGIEHEWLDEGGQAVRTTFYSYAVDANTYWKFTTTIGVPSRFAY